MKIKNIIALLYILVSCSVFSIDHQRSINIVFLNSGNTESPWTESVEEGFRNKINQYEMPVSIYVEYLDAPRFGEENAEKIMGSHFYEKYKNHKIDYFISSGLTAGNFSFNNPDIFPESKRIFLDSGIQENIQDKDHLYINISLDYESFIDEIIRLLNPEKIFIIGDKDKPGHSKRLFSLINILRNRNIRYEIFANYSLEKLIDAVSSLPEKTVLIYQPITRILDGDILFPVKVLERISKKSSVPIFSRWENMVGYGQVGGFLISGSRLGGSAANAVYENESGIKYKNDKYSINAYYYDWREIVKWNLESKILPGSIIRNRENSLYEQYRNEIIFLLIFIIFLSIAILALYFINRKLSIVTMTLKKERENLENQVEERTSELNIARKKAEIMAMTDQLTGLNNRRAFFEKANSIHMLARRYKHNYALLMADIDHFKNVNDSFGHSAGDFILTGVSEILNSTVRDVDLIGRIGGEEFAVILPETGSYNAELTAERIRRNVENAEYEINGKFLKKTISIGIAVYDPENPGDLKKIMENADKALYKAKNRGRNCVINYSDSI